MDHIERRKKNASILFKEIKLRLAEARKFNKENTGRRQSQTVDIEYNEHQESFFDGKTNTWKKQRKTYRISVDGKEVLKDIDSLNEVAHIFTWLIDLCEKQQKVRGWSGLVLDTHVDRQGYGGPNWVVPTVRTIRKVTLADAPCREYTSLQNWLNKYGLKVKPGSCFKERLELGNYVLFCSAMCGKRGVLFDEYGEQRFLDNKPIKCARILEELRKARTTNDTVSCTFGEEDYIDPEERRASSYYEIECEGEKRKYLLVTVTSPSGKVKYKEKVY